MVNSTDFICKRTIQLFCREKKKKKSAVRLVHLRGTHREGQRDKLYQTLN